MKKLAMLLIVIILIAYFFMVFVMFNESSVEFIIQEIKSNELHQQVKNVFTSLGLLLAIQPMLSICLLVVTTYHQKNLTIIYRNAISIYVFISILTCFLIYINSSIIPWKIPVVE